MLGLTGFNHEKWWEMLGLTMNNGEKWWEMLGLTIKMVKNDGLSMKEEGESVVEALKIGKMYENVWFKDDLEKNCGVIMENEHFCWG